MKIKKLLTIGLAIMLTVCVSVSFAGCSFSFKDTPTPDYSFTYGDFKCCYVTSATSNRAVKKESAVGVNVFGFVEDKKNRERVIIPETIDGLPVIAIGMGGLAWSKTLRQESTYAKIYLPRTLKYAYSDSYDIHGGETKPFLVSVPNQEFFLWFGGVFYVSEMDSQKYQPYLYTNNEKGDKYCGIRIIVANLTYIVDGEVYWIDDYEEGEKISFPIEPTKEGYLFDGWYKDKGFLEEWIEEIDQYQKSKDSISVKLYAKFVVEE